jgi:hypothetical protein
MSSTLRHQLPLLIAGQAQKDVTHNEALQGIDRLLHPSVKSRSLDEPPVDPAAGESWIVGGQPIGSWAGMSDSIATFEGYGWAFVTPMQGLAAWIEDEQAFAIWQGNWSNGWPVQRFEIATAPIVAVPVAGATVDTELRQSFAALLAGLQQLGLFS